MVFKHWCKRTVLPGLVAIGMTPIVASCGDSNEESGGVNPKPDRPEEQSRYLPYSIRFDLKGNPVLVDEKGEPIPSQKEPFPLKSTEVKGLQSMSVMTYAGSCKQVYYINGRYYVVNLPPGACGQ